MTSRWSYNTRDKPLDNARDNTRDNPLDNARDMIPKELRLYVGGDGPARKVLLENKSSNTGLLFQGDVCAELRESNYVKFN